MEVRKNEIRIFRGESFTIDKELRNSDDSPFVVSSMLQNPYWLLSVSNTLYSQEGRMVRNYWLPVEDTFYISEVIHLHSIKTSAQGNTNVYDTFDDVDCSDVNIVGYLNGQYVEIVSTDCLWYCNGEYKKRVYDELTEQYHFVEYRCELVKTFTSSDTSQWSAQDYLYSIQLVTGQKMQDYLSDLCVKNGLPLGDNITMYAELLKVGEKFSKDFDVNQPLGLIRNSYPILNPTKLQVIEYAQGELLW